MHRLCCSLSMQCPSASLLLDEQAWWVQTSPNDKTRPLADLDLVVTFLPALLLGVSVGALPVRLLGRSSALPWLGCGTRAPRICGRVHVQPG